MELTAKEIANLLDNLPKKESVDTILEGVKGLDARLAELGKSVLEEKDPEASLGGKGFLDGIMDFDFQGIPIGQAAVGGFAAIFASELVDGFMADRVAWQRGLVKLAVAGIAAKWGKRVLGSTGAKTVALLLAFDAIRDLSPIDSWADQLAERISGRKTTAGLAGRQSGGKPITDQAAPQREKTPSTSYYAVALGGGA